MPEQVQKPHQLQRPLSPQALELSAHWLSVEDELALGCECANPALQIERWAQESALPQGGA